MDGTDNLYSRFIAGLKILLPLSAVALLSVMFLLARAPTGEPVIPYAEIAEIARDPRITKPYFAGIADDGTVIAIAADEVRPDATRPDAFEIRNVSAGLDAIDGSRIEIVAGLGRIDARNQIAELSGETRLMSSSGYLVETADLIADLGTGTVRSDGDLDVETPFGALSAGGLMIQLSEDGTGQQMVFNKGVRLLYVPDP